MNKFSSPFMAKSPLNQKCFKPPCPSLGKKEELTNKQKRKAKKVAKKAVKSMDKLRQAEEIEGRHGYGANKKSERKRTASDRKKEKAKKDYKKMSASEKAYMEKEGKKMQQKK